MRIEKICTLKELVEVRDEWNALVESSSQKSVFLTNEWFCTWFDSFGESYKLSVLLFRNKNDHLSGAAPLMETSEGIKFIASHEVTDYCDFIIEQGREEDFFRTFLEYWKKEFEEKSCLHLINIREESPTLSVLPRTADESDLKYSVFETEVAPGLNLPLTYESYIKSLERKNRHELRRKKKKIDSQREFTHKRVNDPEGVSVNINIFMDLHKKSSSSKREFWQEKGMEKFFRTITALFAANGWIEFNVLYFQDDPAAVLLNIIYHDEILFYNIAFNSNYAPFSPGIYLFNQSIRQAIEDNLSRADFLRGKEKYKYYFGAKECKLMDFKLTEKKMNS